MSQCKYPGAGSPLCIDKPHCPAAQNSYTVHQYTLHPEVCQHCHNPDIRANWEAVSSSCCQVSTRKCCKLQDTWIDNAAKREESISTSYLGEINFLSLQSVVWGRIPAQCSLCSPPGVQTTHQLPPSSPFASNTSHLLLCLSPSESSDISNYRNAK